MIYNYGFPIITMLLLHFLLLGITGHYNTIHKLYKHSSLACTKSTNSVCTYYVISIANHKQTTSYRLFTTQRGVTIPRVESINICISTQRPPTSD